MKWIKEEGVGYVSGIYRIKKRGKVWEVHGSEGQSYGPYNTLAKAKEIAEGMWGGRSKPEQQEESWWQAAERKVGCTLAEVREAERAGEAREAARSLEDALFSKELRRRIRSDEWLWQELKDVYGGVEQAFCEHDLQAAWGLEVLCDAMRPALEQMVAEGEGADVAWQMLEGVLKDFSEVYEIDLSPQEPAHA